MQRISRVASVLLVFLGFWLIMNEQINWVTVLSGIGLAILILWMTNLLDQFDYAEEVFHSPLTIFRYVIFLLHEIALAAVGMVKAIITGRANVCEFTYHSSFTYERALVLLSTAIILTPGSVAVSRTGSDILVRSIDFDAADGIADCQHLENRIAKILGYSRGPQ